MSADREAVFKQLLRSIALSEGEFALLLARCNSSKVRDQVVADLRSHLGVGLYVWHATPDTGAINLVDVLEDAPAGIQAACITGLETSPHLNDILAIANNAREEFRKRFTFPLVLWVTDDVETKLRRRSPDLASWAAPPFVFALEQSELQAILESEVATVLEQAFLQEGKRSGGQELQAVWQEWQRSQATLPTKLEAGISLMLAVQAGRGEAAKEYLEQCLLLAQPDSLTATLAHYRLGLWWKQHGKQYRAEFFSSYEQAHEQFQQACSSSAGKHPNVALELGQVLLSLALEAGDSARWQSVAEFAEQLPMLPAFASGLRAEVALARQDYSNAKRESEQALRSPDLDQKGWYLLSLGRSLIGLNQAQAAISPLEQAKEAVPPEVDPDLHIRILRSLHQAYTAVGNYRQAFTVKRDRQAVEAQYGFRAFIGAGRLRPQRRVGELGEEAIEEIAASGRQTDIDALVERVKRNDCRLTVIHGPSGVGKSSLLQAGLVPALRQVIHQSRSMLPVVVEHYEDWRGELAAKLAASSGEESAILAQLRENDRRNLITVLIFDQFEEFFFKHADVLERRQWYDFLRECLDVPFIWVFLSLREDYVHYLLECDRLANLTLINNDILNKNVRYYLGNFDRERAKSVIRELTERSPYRLESALVDRMVGDLSAELGEVRPIEMQVVGAQMLQSEARITTLAVYEGLGEKPKQTLVERWLTQVVQDCGKENEELAQRVLVALTEEPEKRPVKTKTELQREVRLLTPALSPEDRELTVQGDLEFVLTVLIGSGLAFEIPAIPEVSYQLIHDYLVAPIRQQFGVKLAKQLEEERQKRKLAEANLQKRNRFLLQGSVLAVIVFAALGGTALFLALQANEQRAKAEEQTVNTQAVADSLYWKGLMDGEFLNLEEQITTLEKAKTWQGKLTELRGDNRLELLSTIHRATSVLREKNRFQGHRASVLSVAFSPDGNSILTGSNDNTAKLWSRDGTLLQTFSGHQAYVLSVAFSPDGNTILTGSNDNTAKLWSRDGTLLRTFSGHQSAVNSVAFSPDGNFILTGGNDNKAKLWSHDSTGLQTFSGHQSAVNSVAFSPDGNSILTSSNDNKAKLWSRKGKLLQTFSGHQSAVNSVAFSPDGNSILTGSNDNTAKLWSRDGRVLQTFSEHQSAVNSVAFSPNGNFILTGSDDNTAKLWSRDGRVLQTFSGHQYSVNSVAFSPDGNFILTGSNDKTAKLWSRDGRVLQTFSGHQFAVLSVAFSPDGNAILTGSNDKTAKLWSRDGTLLQTFSGYQNSVLSVAFSPDGNAILTGSNDNTAKLWSRDGRVLQTFSGHQSSVSSVAFSPDGNTILTGSSDSTAKLWNFDLKTSLALNCDHLRDFAAGSRNPDLSEDSRQLRERARLACEGIPPPQLPQVSRLPANQPERLSWLQEIMRVPLQAFTPNR
jgi:WD40 repeat protein/tetratricopeptide (TPR) repeat protein